ncbi:conserved hypothetical protein, membrane, partial [Candidatus Magnetomorum sp. HK-1]
MDLIQIKFYDVIVLKYCVIILYFYYYEKKSSSCLFLLISFFENLDLYLTKFEFRRKGVVMKAKYQTVCFSFLFVIFILAPNINSDVRQKIPHSILSFDCNSSDCNDINKKTSLSYLSSRKVSSTNYRARFNTRSSGTGEQFPGSGNALSFDGSNDYVNIGSGINLANVSFSIECWIKREAINANAVIAFQGTTTQNNGLVFGFRNTNVFTFGFYSNDIDTSETFLDTSWHHWAVTFDSSTKVRKIFRDGIEIASDISATNFLGSGNFYIGSDFISYFHGQIDEFRIWNIVRTETDIRENMCKKLSGNDTNLIAYYRFDNTIGSILTDLSENGNHGTLLNMDNSNWVTSYAAIGDVSVYDYTGTNPEDFNVSLSTSNGDQFTATGDSGAYSGIQLYLINESPNITTSPSGSTGIDTDHYWGIFPIGSDPTYQIVYNYEGNSFVDNEDAIKLAYRDDNSVNYWSLLTATKDTGLNTITKSNETRAEYILAESLIEISPIESQEIGNNPISFTLTNRISGDLTITVTSSNTTIISHTNIVIEKSWSNTYTLTTSADIPVSLTFDVITSGYKYGLATLTVTAQNSDGLTSSTSFDLLVAPFTENKSIILQGLTWYNTVDFVDYDNDADLDIFMTGYTGSIRVSKFYRNTDGNFSEDTNINLTDVSHGSASFGDYDNDGDLDLLLTGHTGSEQIAKIYQNTDGNFSEDTNVNLTGVLFSSTAFGDYDNDGDIDILLTGKPGSNVFSKVYKNTGGSFSEDTSITLTDVNISSVAFADYDNDSDLDIFLDGNTADSYVASDICKIYKNTAGNFIEDTNINLAAFDWGSVAFGDYTNDGYLDILTTGRVNLTKLYKNTGGGFIEDTASSIIDVHHSHATFGDYDNDGDLDMIVTGDMGTMNCAAKVYQNTGGIFSEDTNITLADIAGRAAFGDYDNDGDLDLLISGNDSAGIAIAKVYQNNINIANTPPSEPGNLTAVVSDQTVNLSWSASSDAKTLSRALNYNLRIGSTPGGMDILSPMALPLSNGYRMIPARGSIQTLTTTIKNLDEGTYYWAVQAIDTAFAGSAFSNEYSFTVTTPGAFKALSFDGVDDYIDIGNSINLANSSFTIEFWLKRGSINSLDYVAIHGTQSTNNMLLIGFTNSNTFAFCFYSNDLVTNDVYIDTDWHHWAVTFDSNTKERKIFKNGNEVASDISSSNFIGSGDFYIGNFLSNYYHGYIDEYRIWNNVRSANEIRANMCKKISGDESHLIAYYRFDHTTGSILPDLSGYDNHGSLINMDNSDWVKSGAAIGDVSVYDYTGTNAEDFSVNLSTSDGDQFTATGFKNTFTGIQLYLINESPSNTTPPSGWNSLNTNHYWGVFPVGSYNSNPIFDVTYNYSGISGISNENELKLASRDNRTLAWSESGANNLDTAANVLTKTEKRSGEFILGETGTPTIFFIDDQSTANFPISFTVNDSDGGNLVITATSSNLTLVTNSNINISNSGSNTYTLSTSANISENLTMTLTPVANQHGKVTIHVTVTDPGGLSSTVSFSVIISPPGSGNALDIDSIEDTVNLGNGINLANSSFSIEFWLKRKSIEGVSVAVQGSKSTNNCLVVGFRPTNVFTFIFWQNDLDTNVTYSETDWHHWAVTYDSNTKERKIFRDGIQVAYNVSASNYTGSGNFYIGNYFGAFSNCIVDEFRIWNIARTEQNIRENMCKKLSGSETSLISYYRFDHFSGTTLTDLSGNVNHGTLQNVDNSNWVPSGAALGDTSTYDYTGSVAGDFSTSLSTSNGDQFTATGDGGTYNGIQLYFINESPNTTNPPSGWNLIDTNHYWGIFPIGTNPTYHITHKYSDNTTFSNENELRLAYRQDNSVSTWSRTNTILDKNSNTLNKSGETIAEYILAENQAPIPGGNGLISSSTLYQRASEVTLNWYVASDSVSLTNSLEYRIYTSTTSYGDNIESWINYSTAVSEWIVNTNTVTISNLNETSNYYFAVIVRDESGNKAIYEPLYMLSVYTDMTDINLTGVSKSSVAFGDYDNDGDLDILL